jgi:transketolase
LFANLPDFTVIQPANGMETAHALRYCLDEAPGSSALRLAICPSPGQLDCPAEYRLMRGRGWVVREGRDAVLFAYGPVMLHQALSAAEILKSHDVSMTVVNQPWLNAIDVEWLRATVARTLAIFVLEDHGVIGGLGDCLLRTAIRHGLLGGKYFEVFGIDSQPACGTPAEALAFHQLDGPSLARRVLGALRVSAIS